MCGLTPVQHLGTTRLAYVVTTHSERRGGRVAEGDGLLNRYTGNPVSRVRIPLPPPILFKPIKSGLKMLPPKLKLNRVTYQILVVEMSGNS